MYRKCCTSLVVSYLLSGVGAFLAAVSVKIFLMPSHLIDGGIIGISMIFARLTSKDLLSPCFVILTLPFMYISYKFIRKTFFIQMIVGTLLFALFMALLSRVQPFRADVLEVIIIGGAVLGIGAGLVIRSGGSLDGTEILAIIVNRKFGFTVGQVVLFINIFIFSAYGAIFRDWHVAFQSLLTYVVAFKMMDIIIVGLDELKSVIIISSDPEKLSTSIIHELGLGLTVMYGRGGYSRENREILFVIVERLYLSDLKDLILRTDPLAFVAIENLHEVVYGAHPAMAKKVLNKRVSKKM